MSATVRVIQDTKGAGLDALLKRLQRGEHRVLVGVPAGAGNEDNGSSIAFVAAVVEFGGTIGEHTRAARDIHFNEHAFRTKDQFRFAKKSAKRTIVVRAKEHTVGSFTIPARPFLRNGIRRNLDAFRRISRNRLRDVARGVGTATIYSALETVGVAAVGAVKKYMTSGDFEPNAPSTIKKKGSSQPTIDDAQLRQSITHVVEGKIRL